ncbi:MAG: flagellar basal body-associated FliL family protein, partial [bacterium]
EELAPLTEETEATTKMPFVSEAIGRVLASRTKEQYVSDISLDDIRSEIQNGLNGILVKGKVQKVIFPEGAVVQ